MINLESNGTTGWLHIQPLLTLRSEGTERMAEAYPNTLEIKLTNGMFAIVDADDFASLSVYRWNAVKGRNTWYAQRAVKLPDGRWTSVMMHRQILGIACGIVTDHEDGYGLNNTRRNIRAATYGQNNTHRVNIIPTTKTGYIGVYQRKPERGGSFAASLSFECRNLHLGSFREVTDAALAHDEAARRLYGEFARLNFPEVTDYSAALSRREPPPNQSQQTCKSGHDLTKWKSPKGRDGIARCILCRRANQKRKYDAAK